MFAAVEKRVHLATEVRDSIEIVQTSEYANFLQTFFRVFVQLLQVTPPQQASRSTACSCWQTWVASRYQMLLCTGVQPVKQPHLASLSISRSLPQLACGVAQANTPEQKLRNLVLEILNRLPHNDVLRTIVPDLLKLAMAVMQQDNEENALICLRIIFDLHKNFRPTLQEHVPPFLQFVQKVFIRSTFRCRVQPWQQVECCAACWPATFFPMLCIRCSWQGVSAAAYLWYCV